MNFESHNDIEKILDLIRNGHYESAVEHIKKIENPYLVKADDIGFWQRFSNQVAEPEKNIYYDLATVARIENELELKNDHSFDENKKNIPLLAAWLRSWASVSLTIGEKKFRSLFAKYRLKEWFVEILAVYVYSIFLQIPTDELSEKHVGETLKFIQRAFNKRQEYRYGFLYTELAQTCLDKGFKSMALAIVREITEKPLYPSNWFMNLKDHAKSEKDEGFFGLAVFSVARSLEYAKSEYLSQRHQKQVADYIRSLQELFGQGLAERHPELREPALNFENKLEPVLSNIDHKVLKEDALKVLGWATNKQDDLELSCFLETKSQVDFNRDLRTFGRLILSEVAKDKDPKGVVELETNLEELRNDELEIILENVSKYSEAHLIEFRKKFAANDLKKAEVSLSNAFSKEELEELYKFPRVKEALLSGEFAFITSHQGSSTQIDLTYAVCGFLKAVEIFLYEKLKRSCGDLPVTYYSRKKEKDVTEPLREAEEQAMMLGDMRRKLYKPEAKDWQRKALKGKNLKLTKNIFDWANDVRNSKFHKNNIVNPKDAEKIRSSTIELLIDLCKELK